MRKWLNKNTFWLVALATGSLSLYSVTEDNILAAIAFLMLFGISLCAGAYYANILFTKEILTEYDRLLRQQLNRRSLKLIKGGKDK